MCRALGFVGLSLAVLIAHDSSVKADPCGFVPPIAIQKDIASNITRIGDQITFVFFKDGIEDIVINPAFKGKISEFGMLVPFPSPPALRKVADDIFQQLANAVDPPKIKIQLPLFLDNLMLGAVTRSGSYNEDGALEYSSVRVLKEEAVGMYQAATLEAGSAEALQRWMNENKYAYPKGMDETVDHYIKEKWCFVAIKARVGTVKEASPKPGMTHVDNPLPADAEFQGALHATGFRFKTPRCVVPMRMGTYNEGRLFNRVYYLSDEPSYVEQLPQEMVKKQLGGKELVKNLTLPLPIEVVGGTEADLPKWYGENWEKTFEGQRDPGPHNGKAKELFLTGILAARKGELSHTFEEEEKSLHLVAERMGLKGPQIDEFIYKAIGDERTRATEDQLKELEKMTLTVIEGDFPRDVLRHEDLTFAEFEAPLNHQSMGTTSPMAIALGVLGLAFFSLRRRARPRASQE